MPERRFPPPWSVEETDACFIVRDGNGQALAYVYFEEEPGRRSATHPNDHHDALTSYRVGGIPWVVLSISCLRRASLRRASARSASRTKSFANLNRIAFASASAVLAIVHASAARSRQ
jgi:hypothetical protein